MLGFGYGTNRSGEVRFDDLTTGTWLVYVDDDFFNKRKPHEIKVKPFKDTVLQVTHPG